MSFMPPTDSMFLLAENRDHPMHVGGLQLFVPPEGSASEFARDMLEAYRQTDNIAPMFRKRPGEPVGRARVASASCCS
jgi:diacylglycerol O-acyltransferase